MDSCAKQDNNDKKEEKLVVKVNEGESAIPRKRQLGESLGWIAGSSLQPKKKKNIEGVTASSILELKAQLYKAQQETKHSYELNGTIKRAEGLSKSSNVKLTLENKRNIGVEERDRRDREDLKTGTLLNSHLALERKAELYNKLVSGEAQDVNDVYDVDFVRKQGDFGAKDSSQVPNASSNAFPSRSLDGLAVKEYRQARAEKHKNVRELKLETEKGREKVAILREKRQDLLMQKRAHLRKAYLQKLKASKSAKGS